MLSLRLLSRLAWDYMIYTGELLETIAVPSLMYDVSCASYQNFFISSQNSLIGFSAPSLDLLIPSLLIKKKIDIALEVCTDTCSYLSSRVYFEYAIHMFFQERDYQRSAHYFRKSEEFWAVCSLLRKIISLPPYVYSKCAEFFDKASEKISNFTLLQSHQDFIWQKKTLSYDTALKQRIIHNFIPFFQMIRKNEDETLRLFSDCWLFSALLYLPNQSNELVIVVRDSSNKLPLRYCETVLKSFGKYDLLFELFLSRKIYQPALDLMLQKYSEEKSGYWMVKMKDFLIRVNSNDELFLDYVKKMFCESQKHAEDLLLAYPEILNKINVLEVLVPVMLKYSGPSLVIEFLLRRNSKVESNYLTKLYIEETMAGTVNPKELISFLSARPIKYDPEVVLSYFPKNYLQREKCLVLDLIGKYEEIIHYYIYQEKNLEIAQQYVNYKKTPEVTSLFIMKICKPPMSLQATDALISFLNNADPGIIDHQIVNPI